MARVEINITDGGRRTNFAIERTREVDAVTQAMAHLATIYGPQIRQILDDALAALKMGEFPDGQ